MGRLHHALLCIALTGSVAHAQPNTRRDAAEHFSRGETAQAQKRYREAIAEYEQAYAAVPHANALFNIAFCYEQLDEWTRAADYYARYLDEDRHAPDAVAVTDKIRQLRAKIDATHPPPPPVHGEPPPPDNQPPALVEPIVDTPAPPPSPLSRWHAAVSYGLGFGDVPVERYLARAGMRFGGRFDADAIFGAFGRNDYALGVSGRFVFVRGNFAAPFARAAVTLGYAKQDSSSSAQAKAPIGFELGGGVLLGAAGAFELGAAVRWVTGGWDSTTTTSPSYVNDSMEFAIDFGFVFDFGLIAAAR